MVVQGKLVIGHDHISLVALDIICQEPTVFTRLWHHILFHEAGNGGVDGRRSLVNLFLRSIIPEGSSASHSSVENRQGLIRVFDSVDIFRGGNGSVERSSVHRDWRLAVALHIETDPGCIVAVHESERIIFAAIYERSRNIEAVGGAVDTGSEVSAVRSLGVDVQTATAFLILIVLEGPGVVAHGLV